jgi:CIC family chloride channel protein
LNRLGQLLRSALARLASDPGWLLKAGIAAAGGAVIGGLASWWLLGLARDGGRWGLGLAAAATGLSAVAAGALALWTLAQLARSHGEARHVRNLGAVMAASVAIGVLAGLGAIGFFWLLELARFGLLDSLAGFRPEGPAGEAALFEHSSTPLRLWLLALLPAAGGLVGGWLVVRFAPEAEGHGTDAAIDAYHHRQGRIRGRVPLVKAIASALTIGTGGSAGREGPIAQIGAGLASLLATRLKLARRDRAVLMAAGLAGGIGAIFHAPLAGAIFASEVMYRELDLEHEVIIPSFVSSIVAYSVFSLVFGWAPLFETPEFRFEQPLQLVPYLLLAIVVALGARLFIRLFYGTVGAFKTLRIPAMLKPALGGLAVGLIGIGVGTTGLVDFGYGVLAGGYGVLQEGFFDPAAIGIAGLLLVAFGKMATTSFSVGSGGSGGVFGPATVIGGALGGAVGLLAVELFPTAEIHPGTFVMVGMAGFFAAAGHAPLSTIIMVGEMTGNYHLLVPSMLVCVVAFLLAGRATIFENQLASRLDAPAKAGNMMAAVLRRLPVRQALDLQEQGSVVMVPSTLPARELLGLFAESGQECFPLVHGDGRLAGVVEGRSLRYLVADPGALDVALAHDLATEAITLTPLDNLLTALQRMSAAGRDELVVVNADDEAQPVGTLTHHDVVAAYNRELQAELA